MEPSKSDNMITTSTKNHFIVMTLSGSGIKTDNNSQFTVSNPNNNSLSTDFTRSSPTNITDENELERKYWQLNILPSSVYRENSETGNVAMASALGSMQYVFPGSDHSYSTLIFDIPLTEFYERNIPIYLDQFGPTDKVQFKVDSQYGDESRYSTSFDPETNILTVNYQNEDGTTTNIASFGYTNPVDPNMIPQVFIDPDANGNITVTLTKCFLSGTNILTPEGDVAIENLRIGDMVMTLYEGRRIPKSIVWIGSREIKVNKYNNKENQYPVRIKAHAFGINQPYRDLLITPEHTIYINNKLTPLRMLVNNRSIVVDHSLKHFTVYHIETEDHSILFSENLTTESYLNTDDRYTFNNSKTVYLNSDFDEHLGHKNWKDHAAAPLAVNRDQIEPVWQALNNRAFKQGYAPAPKLKTTHDPGLCLITKSAKILYPIDISKNIYSFYIPQNVNIIAIHSKAELPSETIGSFVDDRRKLGVLISKISIIGDNPLTIIPADMPHLTGWYPAEEGRNDRWTQGLAMLPDGIVTAHKAGCVLRIELTDTACYFTDDFYLNKNTA